MRIMIMRGKETKRGFAVRIVSRLKHSAQFQTITGEVITIPPSGVVTDCRTTETKTIVTDEGVQIVRQVYGEIQNLPEPEDGVLWLVSTITVQAARALGGKTSSPRTLGLPPSVGPRTTRPALLRSVR